MDWKPIDIWEALKAPVIAVLALNFSLFLFIIFIYIYGTNYATNYITLNGDPVLAVSFYLILYVYPLLLSVLGNWLIYACSGYLISKKFGVTAFQSGVLTTFSFLIANTLFVFLSSLILSIVSLFNPITPQSTHIYDPPLLMLEFMGVLGVGGSSIYCYPLSLLIGLFINFITGALSGYSASQKWS